MGELILRIKGGQVQGIYDERLDLTSLGPVRTRRASNVEPDEDGQWWADLSASGGQLLGPFPRRSVALAAEVAWLEANLL